jgi:hypothetical protein
MLKKKKKITDIKKPKKRMKSIWIILLTSLITTLLVGGGIAGYLYWQENFSRKDNNENLVTEEKIEGKNVVIATSNNGNLFINFYNIGSKKTITKKINTDVTIQGGKWDKDNKNEIVQFLEDGKYFITIEIKEPSLSDESEFTRIVKYSKDGSEREILLEDKNSLSIGNFIYGNGKIYYIYTNFEGTDILSKDLYSLDLETKNTELLVEDIGDFLEKELTLRDGKIYSLYVLRGAVYESVIDIASKKITKTNLFRAVKTTDFELIARDVYPSPDFSKYIFMYYTQKEGYQIKLYDKLTKKTSVIKKDKEFSFENIFWKNETEIVFKKKPAFSNTSVAKEYIISSSIEEAGLEKVLLESDLELSLVLYLEDMFIFSEDKKMYLFKDEKKELNLTGFFGVQDTLATVVFDY